MPSDVWKWDSVYCYKLSGPTINLTYTGFCLYFVNGVSVPNQQWHKAYFLYSPKGNLTHDQINRGGFLYP